MMSDENMENIKIVNVVASGELDVELDLASVAEDLSEQHGIESTEHSRRQGNRLLIRFKEFDSLGIISPNGVYVFTGTESKYDSFQLRDILLSGLSNLGIIAIKNPSDQDIVNSFTIQNIVLTASLKRGLNLNALAIGLGLENTEYEPEQFPGLVYKPHSGSCTLIIFASGKIVITGVDSKDIAREELGKLNDEIVSILD